MANIFISYRWNDDNRPTAFNLYEELKNKYDCFLDDVSLHYDQPLNETLVEEINSCNIFICFLSCNSVERLNEAVCNSKTEDDYVYLELSLAFRANKRIVFVCSDYKNDGKQYTNLLENTARQLFKETFFQSDLYPIIYKSESDKDFYDRIIQEIDRPISKIEHNSYEHTSINFIVPYNGKKPYIFVSYSRRDRADIIPILTSIKNEGYRIWFDEGIDPGTEWDQNIASHIEKCGYFLAFVSDNYIASDNCKDELNYARDLEKSRVLIYLEPVILLAGMAMRLNRLQAIHYYTYKNIDLFLEKLNDAEGISLFCDDSCDAFSSSELIKISTLTIEACKHFADGSEEDQFLFLSGWDFNCKKILVSDIEKVLKKER